MNANHLARNTGRNQKERIRLLEMAVKMTGANPAAASLPAEIQNLARRRSSSSDSPNMMQHPTTTGALMENGSHPAFHFPIPLEEPAGFPVPESVPGAGRSALLIAIQNNNESLARLLLQHGADGDRQDDQGQTALHIACKQGSPTLVQLLLNVMHNVHAKDHMGRTALFSAVQGKNEEVVRMLLDAAFDPNSPDITGRYALHMAVERGSEPITMLLLSHGALVDA